MPLLDTNTAAAVVGVSPAQLRLFLSREGVNLVPPSVQGRQRPIPDSALLPITLTFLIARDFGAPLARACELATEIALNGQGGSPDHGAPSDLIDWQTSRTLTLRVDIEALRAHLKAAVAEQLTLAPEPRRRGRPPKRSAGRGRS